MSKRSIFNGPFWSLMAFVILSSPETAAAFEASGPPPPRNVIYATVSGRAPNTLWQQLEQRLVEELGQLDLAVSVQEVSAVPETDTENQLADIVRAQETVAALVVTKQDATAFRVSLFVAKQGERPCSYKEIPITQPVNTPQNETIEVVSLKSVEALQASLLVEAPGAATETLLPSKPPEPKLRVDIEQKWFPSEAQIRARRWALAGMISGALILGAAGGIHCWKYYLENDLNRIHDRAKRYPEDSYPYYEQYQKWDKKRNDHNLEAIRISLPILYSLGGVLTVTGIWFFGRYLKGGNRAPQRDAISLYPTGTGFAGEF